jgi:hypothetical protein
MRCKPLYACVCVWFCGALAGCGPAAPGAVDKPLRLGPRGGVAVALGEKGYAEIVRERTGGANATGPSVLAVYFLQPDLKTPLSAPSSVSLTFAAPEDSSTRSFALQSKPHAGQKDAAPCFVTEAGSFDYDELSGELTATVDGESFTSKWVCRL